MMENNNNGRNSPTSKTRSKPFINFVLSFRILFILFLLAFIRLITLSEENIIQYLEQPSLIVKSFSLPNCIPHDSIQQEHKQHAIEKNDSSIPLYVSMKPLSVLKHVIANQNTNQNYPLEIINATRKQTNEINDLFWRQQLNLKLSCLKKHLGGFYLYHFRKAAGTTVRNYVKRFSILYRVSFHETEGIVLHPGLLKVPGIISLISLRDPINRIKSLYWYEHVLWFHRFANKPGNTRNYHDWVYAWLDGSDWKYNFTAANPGNNYMEIENYYVKALIGWNKEPLLGLRIGEEELERAKGVLESFDIVLITEWLSTESQSHFMDTLFRSSVSVSIKMIKAVVGDRTIQTGNLYRLYMEKDEVAVDMELRERNKYDILLYEYARQLAHARIQAFANLDSNIKKKINSVRAATVATATTAGNANYRCSFVPGKMPSSELQAAVGVFRPPKHKGPL